MINPQKITPKWHDLVQILGFFKIVQFWLKKAYEIYEMNFLRIFAFVDTQLDPQSEVALGQKNVYKWLPPLFLLHRPEWHYFFRSLFSSNETESFL